MGEVMHTSQRVFGQCTDPRKVKFLKSPMATNNKLFYRATTPTENRTDGLQLDKK
jgi:hypothetical protein